MQHHYKAHLLLYQIYKNQTTNEAPNNSKLTILIQMIEFNHDKKISHSDKVYRLDKSNELHRISKWRQIWIIRFTTYFRKNLLYILLNLKNSSLSRTSMESLI